MTSTPPPEAKPSYGDKIKVRGNSGLEYVGWFLRLTPADDPDYPNKLFMILEGTGEAFTLPIPGAIEVLDIGPLPESFRHLAAYYLAHHDSLVQIRSQAREKEELRLKLKEAEEERDAIVLRAFAAAEAEDYCDEVIRIAELANIPVPEKIRQPFQVEFTGVVTVYKDSYTRDHAWESVSAGTVCNHINTGQYRLTNFKRLD